MRIHASGLLVRSCSQILRTRQPFFLRVLVTNLSRFLLAVSLRLQKARLPDGVFECFGHPCQKQPSTKTTSLFLRNVKSGFPKMGRCRRQPVILFCRSSRASAISVALLPRPRMRDITSERFALVKTSGIRALFPLLYAVLEVPIQRIVVNTEICCSRFENWPPVELA